MSRVSDHLKPGTTGEFECIITYTNLVTKGKVYKITRKEHGYYINFDGSVHKYFGKGSNIDRAFTEASKHHWLRKV